MSPSAHELSFGSGHPRPTPCAATSAARLSAPGDLHIGPLRLPGCVILAPMAGVTDAGMRRAASHWGASLTVSEMAAAPNLMRGDAEATLRTERTGHGPHAVQIAGCRAADLAEAAQLAEANGADLIDINMGCPAKRVTGGLAGSALMRDLDAATALIRASVAAVGVPVTVKMRLGWDADSLNAPELARRAEQEGVALVTVHGRTRAQFYTGQADWDAVRRVREAVTIPLVVNGDCRGIASARTMLARSGADAVMVGRAALGRPWLVGDIAHALRHGAERAPPSARQRHSIARAHYESLLTAFGRQKGNRHARKHLAAYAADAGPGAVRDAWRRRLVTSEDAHEVFELLDLLFLSPAEGDAFVERAA